jgi:starch synthase
MGEAGRRRAEAVYDWRIVMGQYLELWNELATLRAAAPMTGARRPTDTVHPDYPDPFSLFRANPTRVLESDDEVRLADMDARFLVEQLRKNALHSFATPSLLEVSLVDAIVAALEGGVRSVAQLDELVATPDHARVLRTIAWLYKYGIVSISRTNARVAGTETTRSRNRE